MKVSGINRSPWIAALSIIAVVFGLATIVSGGRTLFYAEVQHTAGNIVEFVLWFNFLAGFAYVIAGAGLWLQHRWAMWLAFAITSATLLIFALFGLRIWSGGNFEMRTVAAMGLRVITWLIISAGAYVKLANRRYRVAV